VKIQLPRLSKTKTFQAQDEGRVGVEMEPDWSWVERWSARLLECPQVVGKGNVAIQSARWE
jgi:hypothetical protein